MLCWRARAPVASLLFLGPLRSEGSKQVTLQGPLPAQSKLKLTETSSSVLSPLQFSGSLAMQNYLLIHYQTSFHYMNNCLVC